MNPKSQSKSSMFFQCKAILTVTLVLQLVSIHCTEQIIDTNYPIVISDEFKPSSQKNPSYSSHFGYSVAFVKPAMNYSETNGYPRTWLFIGAPKGWSNDPTYRRNTEETGVIWRCSLGVSATDVETCEILHLDPVPDINNAQCTYKCEDFPAFESKNGTWVGAHIGYIADQTGPGSPSGRFVSCASHWSRGNNLYLNGLCYSFESNDVNQLPRSDKKNFLTKYVDLRTYQHRLVPFFEKHGNRSQNQLFPIKEEILMKNRNIVGSETNDTGFKWILGQSGASFHLFRRKDSNKVELLLGAPGVYIWAGAVVRYQDGKPQNGSLERKNAIKNDVDSFRQYMIGSRKNSDEHHWYDYFGYAVTSGYYNISSNELLYVAGAPRSDDLQGAVVIFDFPQQSGQPIDEKYVITLPDNAKQFASYFGSVLLTTNFNGDSYDDLFVGAPLYGILSSAVDKTYIAEGDEGCVFLYSTEKEFSREVMPKRLIGESQPGTRFGSSLASIGDINGDGFYDVAVGAPYFGAGVVYIYLGRSRDILNQQGIITWNQKIEASYFNSIINEGLNLQGFGMSVSNAFDIDGNQTPDIAIGSYSSNQVVVLRTRPSINIDATLKYKIYKSDSYIYVSELPKTEAMFTIELCLKYSRIFGQSAELISFKTSINLDQKLKRFALSKMNTDFSPTTNFSLEYRVSFGTKDICTDLRAIQIAKYSENSTDDIPNIKIDVHVIQETKFKQTNSTLIRHLKITNGVEESARNIPRVQIVNEPAFTEFCPECTFLTQLKFDEDLPISNCISPVCKSKLSISGGFYGANGEPINSFIIGSSKRLTLTLIILNIGDTAQQPKLNIKWTRTGLKLSQKPLECPDDPLTSIDSRPPSTLVCILGDALKTGKNKTIQVIFDMNEVFVQEAKDVLDINTEILTTKGNVNISDATQAFTLTLTSDSSLKIHIVATATKDVYYLNSPFDHVYEVYIKGASPVSAIEMTFKLPINARVKGNTKRIARLIRISHPKEDKQFTCTVPDEAYAHEQDSGSTHTSFTTTLPPFQSTPDGENVDYDDSLPESGIEIARPKRDLAKSKRDGGSDTPIVTGKTEALTSPGKNTALISCDKETDSFNVKCVEIRCTAKNVKPGSIFVVVFNMALIDESAGELLDSSKKSLILLRTHGKADITNVDQSAHDSGETTIHVVQLSLPVATWVYIVAALAGLILLAVISALLYKFGFFRREAKDQLNELKAQEDEDSQLRSSFKRTGSVEIPSADQEDEEMAESASLVSLGPNEYRLSTLRDKELLSHKNVEQLQSL